MIILQVFIAIIILPIIVFWLFKFAFKVYQLTGAEKRWFTDKKVQKMCLAARRGQLKKIDKFITDGADINYVGKDGMTPIMWLLLTAPHNFLTRKSFTHLLKKNINITNILSTPNFDEGIPYTLLQLVAEFRDDSFLKLILKHHKPTKEELNANDSALASANLISNLKNFKTLVDYGADVNFERVDAAGNSHYILSEVNTGGDSWPFVYYLLLHGANYNVNERLVEIEGTQTTPDLFYMIEHNEGHPSNIMACCHGIDYRQKCVDFLKEKGVQLTAYMPKDEKYVEKDGAKVLYIKRNGEWKEYKKTWEYFKKRYLVCGDYPVEALKWINRQVIVGL